MPSNQVPEPPQRYREFIARFPELEKAWEAIASAGRRGPLDEKQVRLLKFAVAIGAMREGAAHASVRKARALGIARNELEQVVALAAATVGLPAAVAGFAWIADVFETGDRQRGMS